MQRFLLLAAILCGVAAIGAVGPQQPAEKPSDVLEGTLRIHPKFHFHYYIDGFGDGQECALFKADDRLRGIKPGSVIRVSGKLASRFFGDLQDKTPAVIPTWIIYMDVDKVDVIRDPIAVQQFPQQR